MFKLFVLLSLLQLPASGARFVPAQPSCTCPEVTNLQKTGQSGSSLAYSWSGSTAPQYRVWYVRREDGYFSGYFYVSSPAYNFTGLSAGHYTFYFQSLCDPESSDYVGVEDVIGV